MLLPNISKLQGFGVLRKVRAKLRVSAGEFWEMWMAVYVQWHLPRWVTCDEARTRQVFGKIIVKGSWVWNETSMSLVMSSVISLVCHVSSRPWSLRCASHYWPICHVICIMTTVWDKKFCCCMIPGGSALSRHPCDVAIDVCQWLCMQNYLPYKNSTSWCCAAPQRTVKQVTQQKDATQVEIWCLKHFVRDEVIRPKWRCICISISATWMHPCETWGESPADDPDLFESIAYASFTACSLAGGPDNNNTAEYWWRTSLCIRHLCHKQYCWQSSTALTAKTCKWHNVVPWSVVN